MKTVKKYHLKKEVKELIINESMNLIIFIMFLIALYII